MKRAGLRAIVALALSGGIVRATELETVEVRAPRVGEAETVPESVTVLSGPRLEEAGVENTQDLTAYAPTLAVLQGGGRRLSFLSLRGVSNVILGQPAVGIYVDGVPYSDVRAELIDLLDVDRVAVYRGPQPIRFGRNAEAGAIDIATREPTNALTVEGSAAGGNFATQVYRAAARGPLGGGIFFSLAGLDVERDGYIENEFLHRPLDDRRSFGGRARLTYVPTPRLTIAATGELHHTDDGGQAYALQGQLDPFRVAYDDPGHERTDDGVGALRADYDGDAVRASSITARRSLASPTHFDGDFTPRDLVVLEAFEGFVDWTEEVRLRSPRGPRRWRWQAGFFLEDKSEQQRFGPRLDDTALIHAPPPAGPGLPFSAPVSDVQSERLRSETASAFGEIGLRLPWHVRARGGLRWQYDRVRLDRSHVIEAPAERATVPVVPLFDGETHSAAWIPTGTLAWRPARRLTAYGTVARGYRPGGFSFLTDEPSNARFRPQSDVSYEAGVKGTWWERRIRASLAAFDVESRDYQVQRRIGFTQFTIANAARTRSRGVDVEVHVAPLDGLAFGGMLGWVDARYERFRLPGMRATFDRNPVALVPEYDARVAGEYAHRSGVFARAEYRRVGRYPFTHENTLAQGAYGLLDAQVGYRRGRFEIAGFLRNATDTLYFPLAIPGGPGGRFITIPGDPRTFGVRAAARF